MRIVPSRDVIFEFRRIGRSVKVTAVDTLTLTEVSVVCPANAAETTLRAAALRKLEYVLKRQRGDGQARS
jgi:hypothetical protein